MGEPAITWFEDAPFEFLSNFHPAVVSLDGVEYPTVEHAYQAAKTLDETQRRHIRDATTPGNAKERGGRVSMRPGWDTIKVTVMRDLLLQKFSDPILRARLCDTAPRLLVEGNTWGDRFWGVCDGEGENWLGRLLMEIRDGGDDPTGRGDAGRRP